MPLYKYQALDSTGKKQQGVVEAHVEREAKEKLRERGLMVVSLTPKASVSSKENLRGDNLLAFTVQLSQLVNAGIPLYESLVSLEEQYHREPFHRILLSLCEQIKRGASLSEAMRNYPDSFDKLYCSMIAAGEAAGALGLILDRLANLLSRQMKLKREIKSAMIYPAILGGFCFLLICMLLGFVVPSIEGIFAERKLNALTSAVLAVSHFFRENWWIYIPVTAITISWVVVKLKSPAGKRWLERNVLKVPVIKNLVIQASVARFTRTMATLQQGGLTMIDSLRMSTEVIRNVAIEEEMKNAEIKIVEGSSLSAQLTKSKYFPSLVGKMIRVGEDSGSSVVMLNKIADMYEENLEKTLSTATSLAQPVILILMGGIIGLVMISILLPLTDVASFSMG